MIQRETEQFDLEQICQSGQCLFYCEEEEFENFWKAYFDLEADYASWLAQIHPGDTYLNQAAEFGSGIRILRQDFWEIIVSFLISQQNHIARIRRCVENICERYGEECTSADGKPFYAFPKPEALAGLEEDALMACNLGYRSKYVVRTARSVASGEFDLEAVRSMSYPKAKEELLKLFGVGEKVRTVSVSIPCIICRHFRLIRIFARHCRTIIKRDFRDSVTRDIRE